MSVLSVCICVLHMRAVTLEASESVRSPETGVGCYPVGSGNPIQVVCKSRRVLNHWTISPAPLQPISLL